VEVQLDKSLLDNVDVGIIVYDREGRVRFVNATHLKRSYYTYEEFMGMSTYDIYNSGVSNVCLFDKVLKSKRPATSIQHTYHGKDGSDYHKLVTAVPILDEFGNVVNVVSTFIDMDDFQSKRDAAEKEADIMYTYEKKMLQKDQSRIICGSREMEQLLSTARTIAATNVPVLLTGESGTGKEVLAQFIHDNSPRRKKPMVVVDCASMPEQLLEAELFGYEKGAFTGANSAGKKGLIETADGGTLFLDEINSMPWVLQSKLLRVLETHQVKRIGALKGNSIDFRTIAATNADLLSCIQEGTFRKDLYYRLSVVPQTIPPLRERKDDIVPLCEHFLSLASMRYGKRRTLSESAYQTLLGYDWPGNVRELKNFIERIVITSSDLSEEIYTIPEEILRSEPSLSGVDQRLKAAGPAFPEREQKELDEIISALYQSGGNRALAAERLGVSRRTLQYKLKKYRVKVDMEPKVYVGDMPMGK